jgi:hypothetical protein
MRLRFSLAVIFAVGLLSLHAIGIKPAAGRKLALIVGVDYPDANLRLATGADIDSVTSLLTTVYDFDAPRPGVRSFKDSTVVVLRSAAETTAERIRAALADLAAHRKAGDVVVIYFAGHGGQVPNQPNESAEEIDGLDETICGSDVQKPESPGAQVAGHIRDDEIAKSISAILGPQSDSVESLTVIFDSCHSGTATRGSGFRERTLPDSYKVPVHTVELSPGSEAQDGIHFPLLTDASRYVFLAAASANEFAFEDDQQGVFTRALCDVLGRQTATSRSRVRETMDEVRARVHARHSGQTPQAEGRIDTLPFSGVPVKAEFSILVDVSGKQPVLRAGLLSRITKGSKFALLPIGATTYVADLQIAVATAGDSKPTETPLDVSPEDAAKIAAAGAPVLRAFILEEVRRVDKFRVLVDESISSGANWTAIETELTASQSLANGKPISGKYDFGAMRAGGYASGLPEHDLAIVPDPEMKGHFRMFRSDGTQVRLFGAESSAAAPTYTMDLGSSRAGFAVARALEMESGTRFLKTLEGPPNPNMNVEIRLVRVKVKPDPTDTSYVVFDERIDSASTSVGVGERFIAGSDHYIIEVRNVGALKAYVHILDIQSDGTVAALWPIQQLPTSYDALPPRPPGAPLESVEWWPLSYRDAAGKTVPIVYSITPPLGAETLKLIATRDTLPLENLITRDAARSAEKSDNPLHELMRMATLGTRSDVAIRIDLVKWCTQTVSFEVSSKR